MKRDLLFLLKSGSEMQHCLLQLTHILCIYYIKCLWRDINYRLMMHSLGLNFSDFIWFNQQRLHWDQGTPQKPRWVNEEGNENYFSPHSIFFFVSPCPSSVFSLSLHLQGSQRISDSEISDYDCEDGVGVITGNIWSSWAIRVNQNWKIKWQRDSLVSSGHITIICLFVLVLNLANLPHVTICPMLFRVDSLQMLLYISMVKCCSSPAAAAVANVRHHWDFVCLCTASCCSAVLTEAPTARPRCTSEKTKPCCYQPEKKAGRKTEKFLKCNHMKYKPRGKWCRNR